MTRWTCSHRPSAGAPWEPSPLPSPLQRAAARPVTLALAAASEPAWVREARATLAELDRRLHYVGELAELAWFVASNFEDPSEAVEAVLERSRYRALRDLRSAVALDLEHPELVEDESVMAAYADLVLRDVVEHDAERS